jgi:hypothetical protein
VLTSEHWFLLSGTVNSDGRLIVEQHFWPRHFFKPWSQIWEIQALHPVSSTQQNRKMWLLP